MSDRDSDSVLTVSDSVKRDLAHLAKHADVLPRIARVLAKSRPGTESVPGVELANAIVTDVGLSSDDAQHIVNTIWNLYRLQKGMQYSADKLIEEMTASLDSQAPDAWKTENLGAWKKARDVVVSLIESMTDEHPLVISGKAAMLGHAHQRIFLEARIITDVRPVFNSNADRVLESLIIHTLLINYYDGAEETRRIEFALDANDVANLRRLCDRAEGKSTVLKAALKDLPWVTTELGGDQSQ